MFVKDVEEVQQIKDKIWAWLTFAERQGFEFTTITEIDAVSEGM